MTERIFRYLREQQPETPCLVIDLDVVENNFRRMKELLPAEFATTDAGGHFQFRALALGEQQLTVLAGVWDRVVEEERSHFVTVFGPSGIGKSRIALASRATARTVTSRCAMVT